MLSIAEKEGEHMHKRIPQKYFNIGHVRRLQPTDGEILKSARPAEVQQDDENTHQGLSSSTATAVLVVLTVLAVIGAIIFEMKYPQ